MVREGDLPGSVWFMVVASSNLNSDHSWVLEQHCGVHIPRFALIHEQSDQYLLDDFVMPFGSLSCSNQ